MMQKVIALFLFMPLSLTILSQRAKECPPDKFYGEWIFINYYKGKLTDINQLPKDIFKSEWRTPITTYSKDGNYIPITTYSKDGNYINDQGDYKTTGKFILDSAKCLLKEFDDNGSKGDTTLFQIMHLDEDYLLITKFEKTPYSYFYKRKKKTT